MEYDSIHDRYIRDKAFRKAMIDHGRTEQMIIEMDKLAKEDHSYKASKEEIEFYRGNWWIQSNVARVDSIPTRYEPEFKSALSTMQRLKRAEDKKKQDSMAQTSSSSSSWPWHSTCWESDYEHSPQKWKNGMTTDDTGKPVFWVVQCLSLLSPTGGVKGTNPAPHIHEHLRYTIMATALRTLSRITTSCLSTLR